FFYIIYQHSYVFHLWRHVLFIFPGMAIIAGLGWEYFIQKFDTHRSKFLQWAPVGLLVVLLLNPLIFIAKTQPNEVTYFNQFVGGPKQAYYNYEFDYYYNGLKPSADYLEENVIKKTPPQDSLIIRSEEHTSELQSRENLVCRL